ncbi:glycosyltransferase family 25 protein [Brumimicrobium aurantiacum]|uniref:Glycosyl transferase family 25 domain-containing protein n=1 Tax=Brumimicrobium aurantiacum TaxID=1737063 RepID=A0A3E1F2A7_9FLAO|nr:glycosyltransferase family 25 protein [Brumimicrobium aurantiacum]RFC55958.1 hypothetical protein DXU93_03200 [Brumimicrobium aurantiacum]
MNSVINGFFEKTFVLNMSIEQEKLAQIEKKMKHVNIDYTIFNAVNGRSKEYDKIWELYTKRPKSTYLEKQYRKKFIESRGAFGYLKTMEALIKQAIKFKYDNILIFDNDCLFDNDFDRKAKKFIQKINSKNWKVILFGASDYGISEREVSTPYYSPIKLKTCGSFAIGIHNSCYKDILREIQKMETPFDNMPLGQIYEKYPENCFVAFPNIVIADVSNSSIRSSRNLKLHSEKMKWKLDNFNC